MLLSRMLTCLVCLGLTGHNEKQQTTKGGLCLTYIFFLESFKTKDFFNFSWVGSSVGERMTEAHGVGGSIPSLPIF